MRGRKKARKGPAQHPCGSPQCRTWKWGGRGGRETGKVRVLIKVQMRSGERSDQQESVGLFAQQRSCRRCYRLCGQKASRVLAGQHQRLCPWHVYTHIFTCHGHIRGQTYPQPNVYTDALISRCTVCGTQGVHQKCSVALHQKWCRYCPGLTMLQNDAAPPPPRPPSPEGTHTEGGRLGHQALVPGRLPTL